MRKPKSIQGATKMPINQCDRLRTLACFLSMAGGENPLLQRGGSYVGEPLRGGGYRSRLDEGR